MKIANPMYDVVFKYLVEDVECAKLLLGELIQKEIIECELLHNEIPTDGLTDQNSGVLKMDFKALVKTNQGKQLLVIIEVQKALRETNLLRFRQYLGSQYANKNNYYIEGHKKIPFPILPIYILGYNIGLDNSVPIIKISPTCYDYTEGDKLSVESAFVESLNHDMIIIQTKVLKKSRRSLLESFLSNFNPEVEHFLDINPKDFDRKYVSLLKRLEEATMKKEIVEIMQRENLLQEEWDNMVLALEKERSQKEEERRQKEEERNQKEDERRQKEEERRQKEEERNQKEDERRQKEEERRQKMIILKVSARTFYEFGLSKEQIAEKLSLSIDIVEDLLS
jgi:DNA repair exonuclease SbcCD nuclease subunit